METKICSKCKTEKPITEFHKDSRGVLGVRADCKACRSARTKKLKEDYLPNCSSELKICIDCGASFKPVSNRQLRCKSCQKAKANKDCIKYYRKTYKPKGYKHLVKRDANRYKDGIGIYQKLKRDEMEELKCERCGSISHLLVHHKDRNRHNNANSNLELLCKSCHQKEHMIRDKRGRYLKSH